jgi:DNA-binding XRE family transcriptional regulator
VIVVAAALLLVPAVSEAQFGGIVYDATNYSNALLRGQLNFPIKSDVTVRRWSPDVSHIRDHSIDFGDSAMCGRVLQEIFHVRIGVGGKDKEKGRIPHETVGRLREELHLIQVDLAAALDVTTRTIQNWEKQGRTSERRLRDLKELYELASEYIGAHQVATWMDSPNDAFQKRTPRETIREGKMRDLILEFHRLQTGEPL